HPQEAGSDEPFDCSDPRRSFSESDAIMTSRAAEEPKELALERSRRSDRGATWLRHTADARRFEATGACPRGNPAGNASFHAVRARPKLAVKSGRWALCVDDRNALCLGARAFC